MIFTQPYAAQWKGNTTPGSFAHVGGHFVLGAFNALANGGNGGDTLLGGTAAGAAEIAIPQLAQRWYGTSDPDKLTAEQKRTVLSLANLGGIVVGGAGVIPSMPQMPAARRRMRWGITGHQKRLRLQLQSLHATMLNLLMCFLPVTRIMK